MLLKPFGAMKGWRGTSGAETGFGTAGEPVNSGVSAGGWGFSRIGIGGSPGNLRLGGPRRRDRRREHREGREALPGCASSCDPTPGAGHG